MSKRRVEDLFVFDERSVVSAEELRRQGVKVEKLLLGGRTIFIPHDPAKRVGGEGGSAGRPTKKKSPYTRGH